MVKKIYLCCVLAVLNISVVTNVNADDKAPVLDGVELNVPAVESSGIPGVFQDVRFKMTGFGNLWQLQAFKVGQPLNNLEQVELMQTDAFPVQVFLRVSGYLSNGCEEVGQIQAKQVGDTFKVFVYYKNQPPVEEGADYACTQALVSFSEVVPLSVYGLQAGEYQYSVNEQFLGTFYLSADNRF